KKKVRLSPEALRPLRAGGDAQRFRLNFSKTGPAALLGHLDLIRELPRVIRRAGAKTAYSQGFHPKPEMSFGPALSLGVASLDEYLDVKLIDPPAPTEFLACLNRAASGGLEFKEVVPLTTLDRAITTIVTGARYVIALAASAAAELGGRAGVARLVQEFLAKTEHKLRRNVEGVGKFVNVREFVIEMSLGGEESQALLERAGLVGRMIPIDVTIEIGQRGSAKIVEVVEALTGVADFPHRGVRTELLAGSTSPRELEHHRKQLTPTALAHETGVP
ncbi:MAG TPA: TIGR03936 family radical SAM-associated protein, partial [Polyangiaceae bacterium]|nr:TIGR03936 family radical SAM-associated protein [Polyangiaceae bacterium]